MVSLMKRDIRHSSALWGKAKKYVHGEVPLLSKKPERYLPGQWPVYMRRAKGIEIVDIDGNKWLDFSYMGVGPNLLGYADPDVDRAVRRVIAAGNQSTLNGSEDVALAEELLQLHPWAGQVRFARTGGEIAAIAIRIARAHARNDIVAFCGYHGWHDWYLAANLALKKSIDGHLLPGLQPLGVPRALRGTAYPFTYNKLEELETLVKKHRIGVIAMEPMRHHEPENGFLEKVRAIADRIGAVLIFDEISSGFRLGFPGAHARFKVAPDIAIYAKAISNGYPMAALVGRRAVMREAGASFISSTYHSERIGPAAALATLRKMKRVHVTRYVERMGKKIAVIWASAAEKHGLPLSVRGPYAFVSFDTRHREARALKALYTQEMLKRGYLATSTIYVSYAHKEKHLRSFKKAVDAVFATLARAIKSGNARSWVRGSLPETGFKRLT